MPKRPSAYRGQWDALKEEAEVLAADAEALRGLPAGHPKVEEQEARVAALCVSKDAVAHGAWETTARDTADVLLLAEIAWDLFWGLGTFPELPKDIDDRDQKEVAVAYLVRGVFDAAIAHQGHTGGTQP
ncbi:MAG TPA: hypothetical protein VGF29_01515 [Hyphomicrobiaceae bacterium]|jgi:hypothetical protein